MTTESAVVATEGTTLDQDQRGEAASETHPASFAAAFPLAIANIRLDSLSPLPIHEQICQAIRAAIAAQELPPGALLPPSRELALHLGVARNTVVYAYARLVAEGLCVSNTRRGTRIASDFPVRASFSKDSAGERSRLHPSTRTAFHIQSALGVAIDRMPDGAAFTLNVSDPALYPRTKLGRRIAAKYLDVASRHQAPHALSAGAGRLQTSLAAYLRSARGVVCTPQQIIPVTGLEGALDLAARVLLDPGDTVQVQDPAMDVVHGAFYAARTNIVPIPTDSHGADPEGVVGPPARLMFVSPSVSFPDGAQMSEQRRYAVLKAAYAQNAIVFENDTYCELRYSGARLSSIQGLDRDGQVVYYSGFMEVLGDSLNVGYLVVPPALKDAFVEMNRRSASAPPQQLQDAIAEFVEEHEYAFHARNVRGVYAERLELMKQACKDLLPNLPTSEPNGGLFVVLRCGDRFDDVAICAEAAAEGVPVRPLSRYFAARAAERGIVFGFGAMPGRAILAAVQQLANVLARHGAALSPTT